MRRSQILQLSNPTAGGKSYFRDKLSEVKDFNLSLQVVINDKRLKEAAESINEVLKEREPESVKEARKKALTETASEAERRAFQYAYARFWESEAVQDFLREDVEVDLKEVELTKKQFSGLKTMTPDQAECLMIFITNINTFKSENDE